MNKSTYTPMAVTAVLTLILFGAGAASGFAVAAWALPDAQREAVRVNGEAGDRLAQDVARATSEAMAERMLGDAEVKAAVKQGMIAFLKDRAGGANQQAQGNAGTKHQPRARKTAVVPPVTDADHVQGPADARYTLIEYSDYECPYCARLHNQVLPDLQQRMGDDLRIVYRHRPLAMHEPQASRSAVAAECVAALQGDAAFWQYTDALYTNANNRDLVGIGASIGVDGAALSTCLDEDRFAEQVASDKRQAAQLDIQGTPTLFLRATGDDQARRLNGAQPASRVAQVFRQLDS